MSSCPWGIGNSSADTPVDDPEDPAPGGRFLQLLLLLQFCMLRQLQNSFDKSTEWNQNKRGSHTERKVYLNKSFIYRRFLIKLSNFFLWKWGRSWGRCKDRSKSKPNLRCEENSNNLAFNLWEYTVAKGTEGAAQGADRNQKGRRRSRSWRRIRRRRYKYFGPNWTFRLAAAPTAFY